MHIQCPKLQPKKDIVRTMSAQCPHYVRTKCIIIKACFFLDFFKNCPGRSGCPLLQKTVINIVLFGTYSCYPMNYLFAILICLPRLWRGEQKSKEILVKLSCSLRRSDSLYAKMYALKQRNILVLCIDLHDLVMYT